MINLIFCPLGLETRTFVSTLEDYINGIYLLNTPITKKRIAEYTSYIIII